MPVRVEALLARSMHDARFRELHKTLPRNPDVRLRRTRKARTRLDPLQSSSSLPELNLDEPAGVPAALLAATPASNAPALSPLKPTPRARPRPKKAAERASAAALPDPHKVTDMRKGDQKVVAVIAVREDGELPI